MLASLYIFPDILNDAGLPAFASIPVVVNVSAVAFFPAVAGVPIVADVTTFIGVLAVASFIPCQSWRPYVIVTGIFPVLTVLYNETY